FAGLIVAVAHPSARKMRWMAARFPAASSPPSSRRENALVATALPAARSSPPRLPRCKIRADTSLPRPAQTRSPHPAPPRPRNPLEASRIFLKVLGRSKLLGIDENRDGHGGTLAQRGANQRKVPLMQRAHRRRQAGNAPRISRLASALLHPFNCADDLHEGRQLSGLPERSR